jgi:hypothetical protein
VTIITERAQQAGAIKSRHSCYPHNQIVPHGADKPRAPLLSAAREASCPRPAADAAAD